MAAEVSPRLGSEGRDSDAGRRWEAGSKGEGLPSPVHLRISVHLLDLLNIYYIYIYLIFFSFPFWICFRSSPQENMGFVEKQGTLFDDYHGGVAQTVLRFWCSAFRRFKS